VFNLKTKLRHTLTGIAGLTLGAVMSSLVVSPAYAAYSFDRAGAVAYAKAYSCNVGNCANPNYIKLGSDCANFVSQALYEGGNLTQITYGTSSTNWYYSDTLFRTIYTGSSSWVQVSALYNQLQASSRLNSVLYPAMTSAYSGAQPGDVYMYDWGKGEGYSHVAMHTSNGTFVDFWDSDNSKNYNSVTGGVGSKLAQHTTDRDGAPWNWGYWIQGSLTIRSKMHTRVLHLDDYGY
jgi:hypothetical protein